MGLLDWLKGKPSTSKATKMPMINRTKNAPKKPSPEKSVDLSEIRMVSPDATDPVRIASALVASLEPIKPSMPVDQTHKPQTNQPSEALLKHSKPGWLLHTKPGEGEPRASRIGGRPYMADDEIWPNCGSCEHPLSLMMQYDLEALAKSGFNHGEGLIRLFYCEAEDCVGMGGWAAFDPQHHLSILKSEGTCRRVPEDTKIHPAAHIVRWEKIEDIPHWEDRSENLQIEDAEPYQGHKFGGWPHWIQGAERPNCLECQKEMNPIIQLDEDHTRSFNFGGGIGHISQCPNHLDSLAFGWACT